MAGAFGVKGEIKLTAYTAEPLALMHYKMLKGEDGGVVLTLTDARPGKPGAGGGEVIARATQVTTRDRPRLSRACACTWPAPTCRLRPTRTSSTSPT